MILKRLKLINYGGIYNGIGLSEIEIDFTKCRNKIILIKGDNGSGKSTIVSALKPLPDDNSAFIPGLTGSKEIEYIDETTGIVYSIKYVHECKGDTRTTKGYFYKIYPDGNVVDLNGSGNITSCKDLVSEELELDANYITLTQLSSTKRGIADLRPADRKRFVNNILASTDVYNNMYKNLSKKASNLKSVMTNIASKIDSVGNIASLEEALKLVDNKITEAEGMMEQYTEVINKEKGMLLSIDPDNKISERIQILSTKRYEYTAIRDNSNKELNRYYSLDPKLATSVITQDILDKLSDDTNKVDYEIQSLNEKIDMLIKNREKDAANLEDETIKLSSISGNTSIIELERVKNNLLSKKNEIEKRWGEIVDLTTITRDEFMSAYDVITNLSSMVSNCDIIPSANINSIYLSTTSELEQVNTDIEEMISFINDMQVHEYKLDILTQRPDGCKDDTCPFIADALQAKAILDDMLSKRKDHKATQESLQKRKKDLEHTLDIVDTNKQMLMIYNSNRIVLSKLNLNLNTYDECMSILKRDAYTIESILRGLIEYANDFMEYKTIEKGLSDIQSKYDTYNSQKSLVEMISTSIEKLNTQINTDNQEIEHMNQSISDNTVKYREMCTLYNTLSEIFKYRTELADAEDTLRIIDEEIEKDKANIDKISKLNSDIEKLQVNISELKEQLKPLREKAEEIRHKITLSNEYTREYEEYNMSYSKIETLKYYCSPTTGIQLLFANMYLNKIMESANNVLSKLFNGKFALLPLVITANEFRIPVAVNGGLNHDDITSMSSAQVALISMIISISLLSQTSTKLNIIVGDEIDAPFDSENRREFIGILLHLMGLVNSSQCVLISHNSEIPMNNCDIILLKCDNDVVSEGNIIWSYR